MSHQLENISKREIILKSLIEIRLRSIITNSLEDLSGKFEWQKVNEFGLKITQLILSSLMNRKEKKMKLDEQSLRKIMGISEREYVFLKALKPNKI